MKISVVIPCYNETENVEDMFYEVKNVLEKTGCEWEIIFSDNASTDDSVEKLKKLSATEKRLKILVNLKNYGPARSSKNALFHTSGDLAIHIACDFQDPPDMILDFIEAWKQGYKVVWGQKTRSEEGKIKFLCRKIFYRIIKKFSATKQYDQISGFGLYDREVIDMIKMIDEPEMSVRHIIPELGYDVKLLPYEQHNRRAGSSSYNLGRYYDFAITSLIRTSKIPLRIATILGLIIAVFSFLIGIFYFVYKMIYWDSFSVGIAPIIISSFFMGAIQLSFMGIIGEYIGVIIEKVSKKPLVIEREKINFEEE